MNKIPQIKIKLSYKRKVAPDNLYTVKNSEDAYHVFKDIFNADTIEWTEEIVLICLSTANKVVGYYKVGAGGLTSVTIDQRVVFSIALTCGATKIMLAHNHPSGNLKPSNADIELTNRISKSGELLDITLLDHLIITKKGYYSFGDEGLV